jgi:hypothetical protein
MQVAVSPSHYNLKDIVQAIEVAGYLNTPPNSRIAATQSNFEFVEGVAHAPKLQSREFWTPPYE